MQPVLGLACLFLLVCLGQPLQAGPWHERGSFGDNLVSFGRVRPLFPGGFAHGGAGDEGPIYMFAFGMGLGMAFRAASGRQ